MDAKRLAMAKRQGATATVDSSKGNTLEIIMKLTYDLGIDTAIEAVGMPAMFELCQENCRS